MDKVKENYNKVLEELKEYQSNICVLCQKFDLDGNCCDYCRKSICSVCENNDDLLKQNCWKLMDFSSLHCNECWEDVEFYDYYRKSLRFDWKNFITDNINSVNPKTYEETSDLIDKLIKEVIYDHLNKAELEKAFKIKNKWDYNIKDTYVFIAEELKKRI